MSETELKWFLTKSTSYPANDFRLQPGQIITHPRKPEIPLFPTSTDPPPTMAGMQIAPMETYGVNIGTDSSIGKCFGLWANTRVLPAEALLEAAAVNHTWWEWRLEQLADRATAFTHAHLKEVLKTDPVKQYIRSRWAPNSTGWNPLPGLWIVTGVRIAVGAKMEMATSQELAGRLKFGVNVAAAAEGAPAPVADVTIGLLGQAARLQQGHASFERASDFIFAYQCARIRYFPVVRQDLETTGDVQTTGDDGQPPVEEWEGGFDVDFENMADLTNVDMETDEHTVYE